MTGGIGCGKSEAAKAFLSLGVPVVDVDKISHALTQAGHPTLAEIAKIFGKAILSQEGELNRPALRQKIFLMLMPKSNLKALCTQRFTTRF